MATTWRKPHERDPVAVLFPRVVTGLLGLFQGLTTWTFEQPMAGRYSGSIVALIAVYLGVHGLWFGPLKVLQAGLALWLFASSFVLGIRGPAMWSNLGVAVALAALAFITPRRYE